MPEIALTTPDGFRMVTLPGNELGAWLHENIRPADGEIALDFEASGRHVDGNWATKADECEPEARVSIAAMAWRDTDSNAVMSCAVPFDQGMIGGKKGRYITKPTRKNPVAGWEYLDHIDGCNINETYPYNVCTCAPWNFNAIGWDQLCGWWGGTGRYGVEGTTYNETVKRIDYFNAKYDMWIALAGLRDGAHVKCFKDCVGWQHTTHCPNSGVDLSGKLGTDLMIVEGIREPAERASLDHVSRKFFGETKDKGMEDGLKANGVGLGKRYDLVSWEVAGRYAGKDAELTLRGIHKVERIIGAGEIDDKDIPIIRREHRKCIVLFNMERRGVGFDVELCREQDKKMAIEVDRLVTELPFKDTNIAAGKYFFADPPEGCGILPIKLTEGGKPACDAEVVARLTKEKGKVGEVAKLWQHIANMKSVRAKWYTAWPHRAGKDGRLRTNFFQFAIETDRKDMKSGGAISGRLSASRVQLQGVPQAWRIPEGIVGIKKLFQPKPGHQVWEFDASNAEVRETARLTRCQALADVINSGVNIHSANTVNIFGARLAATFPGGWPDGLPHNAFKRAGEPGHFTYNADEAERDRDGDPIYLMSDHPEWKKVRTSMKRGIFGTIYASGVRTLKSQIDNDLKDDIPERQIREFMDALNAAYYEIKRTSKIAERRVDTTQGGPGYVRLISGRRRVFGWGERTYKALNAIVQGSVAEQMSELMIAIEDRWPGMLINQVHDSVWLEIPDEMVDEVSAWVKAKGKETFEANNKGKIWVNFKFDGSRLA